MKSIFLYIKTHNKTGLKYFGKTTSKDPYKYQGSGKWWKRHIEKHGYDVTTEIVGVFTDEEECRQKALEFSLENDIVSSNEWANLKLETLDGGFDYINSNKPYEMKKKEGERLAKHIKLRRETDREWAKKRDLESQTNLKNLHEKGQAHCITEEERQIGVKNAQSKESKEKRRKTRAEIRFQQGENNSQFGTKWINNGLENRKLHRNETLPYGWVYGKVRKTNDS